MNAKNQPKQTVSPTKRRKIILTDGKVYYAYNVSHDGGLVHFREEGGGYKTFPDNIVLRID